MKFRLATFNVENLDDDPAARPPLADRIAALRPQLERLAADILCLQEVNAQGAHGRPRSLAALDRLLAGTSYAGYARAVTLNETGDNLRDLHNLVILSRFPIRRHRQVQHELVPPPAWRHLTAVPLLPGPQPVIWDRPVLAAEIDLGLGRPLHLVNLHLRAQTPAFVRGQKTGAWAWASVGGFAEGCLLAEMKRVGQAFETRLLIEQLFDADADALVAVAGDYNAAPNQMPAMIIRAAAVDTGNPALAARALHPLEATLPAARRYSVVHGGEPLMLDHVMVSNALLAGFRGAEILNEDLADELVAYLMGRRPTGSYHAPLVATFELS